MYVAEQHHGSRSLFWLVSCQVEEESHLNMKLGYQHPKNTRLYVLILVHSLTLQIWEEGGPLLFKKTEQAIYCTEVWILKKKTKACTWFCSYNFVCLYLNTEATATVKTTPSGWKNSKCLFCIMLHSSSTHILVQDLT